MRRARAAGISLHSAGLSLVELLLALALSSLLILGLAQIVAATSAAGLLQRNQGQLLENARLAAGVLSRAIRQAGYRPEPWNPVYGPEALGADNRDSLTASSDRLAVREWSDRNCFDVRNPDRDEQGRPRFYIRELVFDLNNDHHLTRRCRYGPSLSELHTEIQRQGLVPGVESFQLLYGEGDNGNDHIERWVRAGEWRDPQQVLAVRVGMLLAGEDAVTDRVASEYPVLDTTSRSPADGRLRRALDFEVAIRGRAR